jgi:hypothetical protein
MLDGLAIMLLRGAVALDCDAAALVGLAGYITVKWLGLF